MLPGRHSSRVGSFSQVLGLCCLTVLFAAGTQDAIGGVRFVQRVCSGTAVPRPDGKVWLSQQPMGSKNGVDLGSGTRKVRLARFTTANPIRAALHQEGTSVRC